MRGRWSRFIARLDPSCRATMQLVSRSFEQALGRVERLSVAVHMLLCPACRRSRKQISILVSIFRRAHAERPGLPIPGLPDEVREQIKRSLREE